MKLKNLLLVSFLALPFMACSSGKTTLQAQPPAGGGKPGKPDDNNKPTPDTGKKVEDIQPLVLQKPTMNPDEYRNVMKLEFADNDQAWFSFGLAATSDSSLFFSTAQMKLTPEGCTKPIERTVTFDVIWQEVQSGKRVVLKRFADSITEYPYQAKKTYILSYVLSDLKKDFADCKGATLKFASHGKKF
jgi:hypothetical protein